jgi:hypothetical protein
MAILLWSGPDAPDVRLLLILVGGVVVGLALLVRGFGGYRAASQLRGIAPSRISSIAAGEVLVVGTAEPIELTLVSPLQSSACLYYRSRVSDSGDGEGGELYREERAVGFRVRDPSGTVRVFPAGARFDVPDRFDEQAGRMDGDPPGLLPRTGSAFGPGIDRDARVAALLTVRDPRADPWTRPVPRGTILAGAAASLAAGSGRRHFVEARIDAGDVVTVVGRAMPFGDLADPAAANLLDDSVLDDDDPEVAGDLAEARAAGLLAGSAEEAWGNAAIEGFGIGQPVRPAELDPAANPLPSGDPSLAARVRDAFEIAPESLVLASSREAPLLVSLGAPREIVAREQGRFITGLLGAVVAIGSAVGLAWLITNGVP